MKEDPPSTRSRTRRIPPGPNSIPSNLPRDSPSSRTEAAPSERPLANLMLSSSCGEHGRTFSINPFTGKELSLQIPQIIRTVERTESCSGGSEPRRRNSLERQVVMPDRPASPLLNITYIIGCLVTTCGVCKGVRFPNVRTRNSVTGEAMRWVDRPESMVAMLPSPPGGVNAGFSGQQRDNPSGPGRDMNSPLNAEGSARLRCRSGPCGEE